MMKPLQGWAARHRRRPRPEPFGTMARRRGCGGFRGRVGANAEVAMKVGECMTRDVRMTQPDDTLRDAAMAMAQCDAGILPVSENDRLVGMITDRDIAIRGVACGKG